VIVVRNNYFVESKKHSLESTCYYLKGLSSYVLQHINNHLTDNTPMIEKKNPNYNSYFWLLVMSLGEVGCSCIFIIYYDKAKVIGFPLFAVHNFTFNGQ
jgi:hypothetical protein